MATRRHTDFLRIVLFLTALLIIAVAIVSGKFAFNYASPVSMSGTQWQVSCRHGLCRVIIVENESELAKETPGFKIEELDKWRLEWWYHLGPKGKTKIYQLPLWFPALALLAWFMVRGAKQHMRLVRGVCPSCGKPVGSASRCPKCGVKLSPQRA